MQSMGRLLSDELAVFACDAVSASGVRGEGLESLLFVIQLGNARKTDENAIAQPAGGLRGLPSTVEKAKMSLI